MAERKTTMARFKVTRTIWSDVFVEADSADEAINKAEDIDFMSEGSLQFSDDYEVEEEVSNMKTYRVWAKVTRYLYIDVEAESPDEANKLADEADGSEFREPAIGNADWEIVPNQTSEVD